MQFKSALSKTFNSRQFLYILDLCRWHSWKFLSPLKTSSTTVWTDRCQNNSFGTNSLAICQQKYISTSTRMKEFVNRNTSTVVHILTTFQKQKIHWQCWNNFLWKYITFPRLFFSDLSLEQTLCPQWVLPTSSPAWRGTRPMGAWRTRQTMRVRWTFVSLFL